MVAVTQRPGLMSENNLKIHRKDRANRIGDGVMLEVRNNILIIRRKDLEYDHTEMLASEIRPKTKKSYWFLSSNVCLTQI